MREIGEIFSLRWRWLARQALINESIAQPRFRTWLIGVFSIFALTLACLGIYGVIAYLVTQRYKEIGIRIALGADRRNVVVKVVRETMTLVGAGVIIGLAAAWGTTRLIASTLFGVTAMDPPTLALAIAAMMTVALLAGFIPARRAAAVNPVIALRQD